MDPISLLAVGRVGAAAYFLNLMEHKSKDDKAQTKLWVSPGSWAGTPTISENRYPGYRHGFALWRGPAWPWVGPLICHCCLLPTILICSVSSLAAGRKSLTYFNHDSRAALQEITFDLQDAKKIFFGSFHKVLGTA